jgi:hypothetical protein
VPVWVVLAVLLVLAVASAVVADVRGTTTALVATGVLLAAADLLSLYTEWHTVAALAVTTLVCAVLHLRADPVAAAAAYGAAAPLSTAGLVWAFGATAEAAGTTTALVGMLVLAAPALLRGFLPEEASGEPRAAVEIACGAGMALLTAAGVGAASASDMATWTAIYLTLGGATASALALLHEDRRLVGWLGGLLLAAASWVRLADIGVDDPEPYTLPSALALVVVGLVRLRRNPAADTLGALAPGLGLALVPSLLWALEDPVSLRAGLLGLVCVGLVVAGVELRWSAPLLAGATVGLVLVVREAAPYIGEAVPRWALIGAAGVLLIGLGITWEQRLRDARTVAGYVRGLR